MLATAESCTGGLIAAACTHGSGSSQWFDRGFVTYSNAAKSDLLSIPAELIIHHGAVSEAVARAMAQGACAHSVAAVSIAVTGIAGPDGGTQEKPVGTVWLSWCIEGVIEAERQQFTGDREAIRQATVIRALSGLLERIPS